MSKPLFNPQTANAVELTQLLGHGQLTSVQIVEAYLAQIDLHNPGLNALISRSPRENVLRAAERLDQERSNGKLRGPLHGIPIILKDCFTTASDLGMSTTCGSIALVGAKASKNSAIVQKMIDGGLIILAKANMTEFCGMKMTYMMPGWSAHGGQTLSPYVRVIEKDEKILGHSAPGGSSTGSAVSLSAGFAPLAMGTETIGSIITPTSRNALYGLKPTVGAQDTTGMYTMTEFYDSPGPMAKSAADVRELAGLLLDKVFDSTDMGSWKGLSVGIVDPRLWTMDESMCRQHDGSAENMVEEYESMVGTLRKSGCSLQYPFAVPDLTGYPDTISLAHWDFKNVCMPEFLKVFDECPVSSVEDIVKFNEENKERAMPEPYTEQNDLIKAMNSNDPPEAVDEIKKTLRGKARTVLDTAFDEAEVNLLVGTCDSAFCVHAAAAGYPVAAVPLSTLKYNGRPFGLCVIAQADGEEALLRFMAAYEAAMPSRTVPVL
ncbi:Amidase signature domain protein [Akanthomyces lecanii RCEF 1005]|uniref:Amidase signature domain protein n=1 Tax=Akanthomyces lecanii RCEF 1005 TaxID=1081108 RepID=A0A162JWG9_CORDF|nr:Amidase signature domain protein [Akanthomyces lecanii RCEF 1005]